MTPKTRTRIIALSYADDVSEAFREACRVELGDRGGVVMSEWQPIETAPRDGSSILALVSPDAPRWAGRAFVIRHEGKTPSDFDMGWAIFPGYGGADDRTFTHWMPLPDPPA